MNPGFLIVMLLGVSSEVSQLCRESTQALLQTSRTAFHDLYLEGMWTSPAISQAWTEAEQWPTACAETVEAWTQVNGLAALETKDIVGCVVDLYKLVKQATLLVLHIPEWQEEVIVEDLYVIMQVLTRLVKECQ